MAAGRKVQWQEQEAGWSPYIHAEEAKAEWEMGQAVKPPSPLDLCDQLLLAGFYIPKVPQPSHTVPPSRVKVQTHEPTAHCHV